MRAIDADVLTEIFIDRMEKVKKRFGFNSSEAGILSGAYKLLQSQPTIESERKKGKWIPTDDGWDGEYFVCSVCGCPWTLIEGTPEDNGMNFCPNCGADMRGTWNE